MSNILKSAIVGCGGIAQVHANSLKNLPLSNLVACADIKFERAEKMAEEYGCSPYSSLEEMLKLEDIDVLHICTPHYLHTPMAQLAAEKGIKIFTEKPPVISMEQWEDFSALKNKTPVGICFQNRYNKSVQYIKGLIEKGKAGKILGARAIVTWSRGEKYYTESGWRGILQTEGGGALINQSIHTLDLLIQFMGQPIFAEATCINHHLKGVVEVEDTLEAFINFGDANAIFFATTAYSTDSPVMVELNCENMTIKMEEQSLTIIHGDKTRESITFSEPETLGKAYWGNGHYTCIEDYYKHILCGENPPINIDNVEPTAKAMLAIYKSARESHRAENI